MMAEKMDFPFFQPLMIIRDNKLFWDSFLKGLFLCIIYGLLNSK